MDTINNINNLAGKKVLIFQQRVWAVHIGHFLAKKLQAEGCGLAAVTFKRNTHEFITHRTDVKYDLIISNDEVMGDPKKYLGEDDFSLKEICENLNVDSIWPIVSTARYYVKSYGDKYYYGFKQNVSDEVIIYFIKAVYKYIKIIFNNFKPDIIIGPNLISMPHIMMHLYAAKRGIKTVTVVDSKIQGYTVFSYNPIHTQGPFTDRVDALNKNVEDTKSREGAKKYIEEFRESFKEPDRTINSDKKLPLIKRIRYELSPYKSIASWYVKGPSIDYIESAGISIDYRPPKIILRDHFCHKKYNLLCLY